MEWMMSEDGLNTFVELTVRTIEHIKNGVYKPHFLYSFINYSKYSYVLVYRWDRYSRNLKEALINLDYFEKIGIEVNSVEQHIDFNAADYITMLSLYISMA